MSRFLKTSRYISPKFKKFLHSSPKTLFPIKDIGQVEEEPSKLGPPPIRVGFTNSAGRGVFSTRRIGSGDLIHTANPIVSHPFLSKIDSVCYLCLRRLKPRNIGQCDCVEIDPFCSDDCREQSKKIESVFGSRKLKGREGDPLQKTRHDSSPSFQLPRSKHTVKAFYELEKTADWSMYHKYCRTLGLKYPLLVKRLACMLIAGAASADCIDILQPAQILPEIEEEYSLLRSAFEEANTPNESLKFLSNQWYANVLARIRINAFRIEMASGLYEDLLSSALASVEAEAGVGNAVYILPSFYNHDCDPNVHIIWMDNVNARLKALRDIEEGEALCICYIDAIMAFSARQNVLLNGFGFKCSCSRCLSGD